MKASGEVINALLLIILMLGIATIVLVAEFTQGISRQEIVLAESMVMRTKSMYELVGTSLDTTWYVSSIQSIYKTGDNRIGCPEYWYDYDPSVPKTNICVDTAECAPTYPALGPRIPLVERFNPDAYNPRICYPRQEHITESLGNAMEPFLGIQNTFSSGSVSLGVTDLHAEAGISFNDVSFDVDQHIKASFGTVNIENDKESAISIETEFLAMGNAAGMVVGEAIALSDTLVNDSFSGFTDTSYSYDARYQDMLSPLPTPDHRYYEDLIANQVLVFNIEQIDSMLENIEIKPDFQEIILMTASGQEAGIWPPGSALQRGLILHYDLKTEIVEGYGGADTISCIDNSDHDGTIMDIVGEHGWTFGRLFGFIERIHYDDAEIAALVKAIIQHESSWSPAASGGLMGLKPDISAACGLSGPQINNPQSNIQCGIGHVNELFSSLRSELDESENKENLIKLVLTAYNTSESEARQAIGFAGTDDWDAIAETRFYLDDETVNYVYSVLGHFTCYGGAMPEFADLYYYHDESKNRFMKRPFSLGMGIRDYLPVIDCAEEPYDPAPAIRLFSWDAPWDMACASGCAPDPRPQLYTCDKEIPNIGTNRLATGTVLTCSGSSVRCDPGGFVAV